MSGPKTEIGECQSCDDYRTRECFCRVLEPAPNWGCQEWRHVYEPSDGESATTPTIPFVPNADLTDGNWYMLTMGAFIEFMVDSGHDPAIDSRWRRTSTTATARPRATWPL